MKRVTKDDLYDMLREFERGNWSRDRLVQELYESITPTEADDDRRQMTVDVQARKARRQARKEMGVNMEEKAVMLDRLQAESLLEMIVFFRQDGGVTEWGEFEELRILSEAIARPFGLKVDSGLTQTRPGPHAVTAADPEKVR